MFNNYTDSFPTNEDWTTDSIKVVKLRFMKTF